MLNLKVPPPIIGVLAGVTIWICQVFLQEWTVSWVFLEFMAYAFIIVGILIELASVSRFIRAKTTINPLNPARSSKLVTSGMYHYSRNPMYLGMFSILLGIAFWFKNPLGFLPLIPFVWYITTFQIKPEERILLRIFGNEYKAYQKHVRRWL